MKENDTKVLLKLKDEKVSVCIYVNKKLVAESYNGYLPLVVDIKHALVEEDNEIIVIVKDELNHIYPYGKQRNEKEKITDTSSVIDSSIIDRHFSLPRSN